MKNFDLWMSISGSLLIAAPIQAQKKAKEKQPIVIFIIAALSFFPVHALSTIAEHLSL